MKKIIEIDFDDIGQLIALQRRLNRRLKVLYDQQGHSPITFNGTKTGVRKVLPLLEAILATDISSLYNDKDTEPKYYVYAHCDPRLKLASNSGHELQHDQSCSFLYRKGNWRSFISI